MTNEVFRPLSMKEIARMINAANKQVTLAAPGIDEQIAGAVVAAAKRLGGANVQIILDVAEENCRAGYGNILGYTTLLEAGVPIRGSVGLRIGIIICDHEGYIFATPPLMIEAPDLSATCPNAIRASRDQIHALIAATAMPTEATPMDCEPLRESGAKFAKPEIGKNVVSAEAIKKIERNVEQNPIQDLDLSRVVNVFTTHIQLGELQVAGTELQNHTVRLPASLLTIIKDDDTRKRVTAAFKIVADESSVSGQHIAKMAAGIRRRYFRRHPKFGAVFLKARSAALHGEIATLENAIEKHKQSVRRSFAKESQKSKIALAKAFWRAVQKSPPEDLQSQLSTSKPSTEQAKAYLMGLLDRAFPDVEKLCHEMNVRFVLKDLTWETLNEEGFVAWLATQYTIDSGLKKPFDLYRAAKARAGNPEIPTQTS